MRELDRRVWADEPLTPAESYAWRKWAGYLTSEPRRKTKEEEEKTSSCSSSSVWTSLCTSATCSSSPRSSTGWCLRSSSSPECGTFLLWSRDEYAQCQHCAEDRRFFRCSSWWMLTRPLLRNDRDMVRQCRKPCWCRRCSPSKVVFPSCRRGKSPRSCDPHGPVCPENHRISPVAVCQVVDAPVVQVVLVMPVVDNSGCARFRLAKIRGGAAVAVPSWLWTSL